MTPEQRKYLLLLSEKFPTIQAVYTEIINLEAILNLPSATEHFISDVHGEYQAFSHILNNCSGVIRERVGRIFRYELTPDEQADFCTLIYYPKEKLAKMREEGLANDQFLAITLMRLMRLARHLSYSYTRSKVRKAMPVEYAYIIDELLHATHDERATRQIYHSKIIDSIIETGSAEDFIVSACALIKRLAVDRLHFVGDFFDRGPHADIILDKLMQHHSVDIQWGNHDVVWMGAAGSEACIAAVIRTNIHYGTLDILERAYGITLRELALFADRTYTADDGMTCFEKAVDVILFKLEGQLIKRHPGWDMDHRLLLHKVDAQHGTVEIDGVVHQMRTREFPTIDPDDPYALSPEEQAVVDDIVESVRSSQRLRKHIDFLYKHGSAYLVHNGNVLFHGCMPLEEDGSFAKIRHQGKDYSGRAYFDLVDSIARRAWSQHDQEALDWMWYLWCGNYSPMSGRIVKTFERAYLDQSTGTWNEPRNAYYDLAKHPDICDRILAEFDLAGPHRHIINGHTPVRAGAGESPLKAGGRLIVIDGGFCNAYHKTTGIAGYTLIADPGGMRIKAHRPFTSIEDALDSNADIYSEDDRFEVEESPLQVKDTDTGVEIRAQIADLRDLLDAYRSGELKERGTR